MSSWPPVSSFVSRAYPCRGAAVLRCPCEWAGHQGQSTPPSLSGACTCPGIVHPPTSRVCVPSSLWPGGERSCSPDGQFKFRFCVPYHPTPTPTPCDWSSGPQFLSKMESQCGWPASRGHHEDSGKNAPLPATPMALAPSPQDLVKQVQFPKLPWVWLMM